MLHNLITKALLFLGIAIAIISIFIFIVYRWQDKLVFMNKLAMFKSRDTANLLKKYPYIHQLTITTADGIQLQGWYINKTKQVKAPLLIYFGGNAQEVSEMVEYFHSEEELLRQRAVLFFNYRGYGESEGLPKEQTVLADALFIYDTFASNEQVDSNRIAVMGWSLGTGVAVEVAQQRLVDKVILICPYDSIIKIVEKRLLNLPFGKLVKHPFNSAAKAPYISSPLLAFAGDNDKIIPVSHSENLVKKWKGTVKFQVYQGEDHYFLFQESMDWKMITDFLKN